MLPKDPFILLSYVNTMLRDRYASLEEHCEDLELDRGELERRLKEAGAVYDPVNRRFS